MGVGVCCLGVGGWVYVCVVWVGMCVCLGVCCVVRVSCKQGSVVLPVRALPRQLPIYGRDLAARVTPKVVITAVTSRNYLP